MTISFSDDVPIHPILGQRRFRDSNLTGMVERSQSGYGVFGDENDGIANESYDVHSMKCNCITGGGGAKQMGPALSPSPSARTPDPRPEDYATGQPLLSVLTSQYDVEAIKRSSTSVALSHFFVLCTLPALSPSP
jgi:hypothetical protein